MKYYADHERLRLAEFKSPEQKHRCPPLTNLDWRKQVEKRDRRMGTRILPRTER